MDTSDNQVLAEFMRHVLYPNLEAPDLKSLEAVSDEGLREFVDKFAEALGKPSPNAKDRSGAIKSIDRLLLYYVANKDTRNDHHIVPEYIDSKGGDQGIHAHKQPNQSLDAAREHNITQHVLRLYRALSGWESISRFAKRHHYEPDGRFKSLVPKAIEYEVSRYRIIHPDASPQEVNEYIQSEYIARTGPEHRTRPSITIWLDLSPKAQEDMLSLVKSYGYSTVNEYTQVTMREGWKTPDSIGDGSMRATWQANNVTSFLDTNWLKKIATYRQQHEGVSLEEATKHVNDTYMWRNKAAGVNDAKKTRRVLSPEAQQDIAMFLESKQGTRPNRER